MDARTASLAEALEALPRLQQALREGAIPWSTARELSRVATPASEQAWLDVVRGKAMRQIEQLVARHAPGDLPGDAAHSPLARHILRLEVSAETFATFREAMAKARRDSDHSLDDDSALLLMARQMLSGPSDEGRANYQVAMTICQECRRGWQQGRGESVEVGAAIVEMASCDVQNIAPAAAHGTQVVRSNTAAHDTQLGHPDIAAHDTHVGDLDTLAQGAHVGDVDSAAQTTRNADNVGHFDNSAQAARNADNAYRPSPTGERVRAHQPIPPSVRREVLRRDGGRCIVAGCRHATFLDLHHLIPRAEGGNHDPDTLVTLCSAHHRAQHRGQLVIEGRPTTGLLFRHADGSSYGTVVNPMAAETCAQEFRALCRLGFREREARTAIEQVRARAPVGPPVLQTILRDALAVLTAGIGASARRVPRSGGWMGAAP
jgi:hypothetical protein